jgi:hypothetical protein
MPSCELIVQWPRDTALTPPIQGAKAGLIVMQASHQQRILALSLRKPATTMGGSPEPVTGATDTLSGPGLKTAPPGPVQGP